jgi:hypothetical protein
LDLWNSIPSCWGAFTGGAFRCSLLRLRRGSVHPAPLVAAAAIVLVHVHRSSVFSDSISFSSTVCFIFCILSPCARCYAVSLCPPAICASLSLASLPRAPRTAHHSLACELRTSFRTYAQSFHPHRIVHALQTVIKCAYPRRFIQSTIERDRRRGTHCMAGSLHSRNPERGSTNEARALHVEASVCERLRTRTQN